MERRTTLVGEQPPTSVHRPSWGPVLWGIVVSAGFSAGSLYGLIVHRVAVFAVFAAAMGFVAGASVLLTARARTEIGPDGIGQRVVRRSVLIPWSDLTDVRVTTSGGHRWVQVVRRDGEWVTVAALRGSALPPDPPFDDAVEAIRWHIERHRPAGAAHTPDASSGAPAQPLSLRPPRRPLLWLVPLAVVSATLLVTSFAGGPGLAWLPGGVIAGCGYVILVVLRGRTDAGTDGVRNHYVRRTTFVPWSDVERLSIVPSVFGRSVHIVRRDDQHVLLAAPREMLLGREPGFDAAVEAMRALAAPHRAEPLPVERLTPRLMQTIWAVVLIFGIGFALFMDGPWLEPWWPTRHEATQVPDACEVAGTADVRRLVPDPAPEPDGVGGDRSRCRWSSESSGFLGGNRLELELDLQHRTVTSGGSANARERFASRAERTDQLQRQTDRQPAEAVSGLGDEAWRTVDSDGDRSRVRLLVRNANVLIEVQYNADMPADDAVARAEAFARAVVDRIPLS